MYINIYIYIYIYIYIRQIDRQIDRLNRQIDRYRYIFIWTHGQQEIEKFLKNLNSFTPNMSFIYETSKNCILFLDLKVKLIDGKLETDLYMKPTDRH